MAHRLIPIIYDRLLMELKLLGALLLQSTLIMSHTPIRGEFELAYAYL